MRQQGVDIFPDCDSHCYIEGLPLKDIPTERHLYYCMALTANSLRLEIGGNQMNTVHLN